MTQTHRQALPKGYMLHEYQVDRVLGAGGFGLTYLGWDTALNKPVAIKEYLPNDLAVRESDHSVLPKSDGDKENFQWGLDRFLDEARALASFKHPNIIGVHRYFEAHNTAYIVMEFAEGETLSALLERQKVLDEPTLLAILNPLLDGLAEVHRADFLHRDIKPGNILIRADGSPVLLDFGAARQAIGSRSRSITSIVTPGYAPVEQYDTRGNQGPWTDIYALGAVAYRAVCGEVPPDSAGRARKGKDTLIPAAQAGAGKHSAALLGAIDWALAVDEEDRPQSIAEWRKALSGEAAQKQAPAPAPKPAPAPVVKPAGKARMVGLALAVAVTAGGATVGYDYYQQRQSEIRQAQQAAEQESATAREEAEAERRAADAAAKKAAEEKAARQEAERLAREKAEAERRAAEAAAKKAAEEQAARQEAERLAREQAEAERRATEAAAKKAAEEEAAKKAAEEALAQKVAQEEAAAQEAAARKAKAEAEAAEAAARKAKAEAEAAEAALRKAEAERQAAAAKKAAEEAAKREAERLAREQAEAERRAAEQAAAEAARREEAERKRPGRVFQDCPDCPQMVIVPAGSFMMGSSASERGRDDNEGPAHRVRISSPFAVGVYEVTRGEYARFVSATGHSSGSSCWTYEGGEWEERSGRGWRNPGFSQNDDEPVVCVNWDDAQRYVRWLSAETGESYRLLSEAEWEYVARAGTTTARYWGESESGQCRYANGADRAVKRQYSDWEWTVVSCDDGFVHTAAVGNYDANGFGLHDVLGNVWEWTQDCWNDSYRGAPSDGSAWESGECSRRVLRGGSWNLIPRRLRSADRFGFTSGGRSYLVGFRVARTLTP